MHRSTNVMHYVYLITRVITNNINVYYRVFTRTRRYTMFIGGRKTKKKTWFNRNVSHVSVSVCPLYCNYYYCVRVFKKRNGESRPSVRRHDGYVIGIPRACLCCSTYRIYRGYGNHRVARTPVVGVGRYVEIGRHLPQKKRATLGRRTRRAYLYPTIIIRQRQWRI